MRDQKEDFGLIQRCLKNDPQAFEKLIDRYKNPIFSLIYRLARNSSDAEDLAQETFLKVFKNLSSYDTNRPFSAWLFRICHNTVIDHLRARKPHLLFTQTEDELEKMADQGPLPEQIAEFSAQAELIENALALVPPSYREVLILRHQEGMNYKEMAEILQIPEGTVKIRLFRGRSILKRNLETLGLGGAKQ